MLLFSITEQGIDYEESDLNLTFPASSYEGDIACGKISIIQDDNLECTQDFTVNISATSPPIVIDTEYSQAVVTIVDDDSKNLCR